MEIQMSDEKPKKLTLEDPVSPETLHQLRQIHDARLHLCERAVDLDQEKIQVLAAIKRLDDQKHRVFEGILVERGLPPQTQTEIDGRTGKLRLIPQPEPPVEPQEEQPADEAS
jgi:hypothetical protein